MYILSVIPLAKIPRPAPQTLDYFSSKRGERGGIIEIVLGKRTILAIIVACVAVRKEKQQVKKASFALKPIKRIINGTRVIPEHHLSLIIWASSYYYASAGLIAKFLLPQMFSKPTKRLVKELAELRFSPNSGQIETEPQSKASTLKKPILYWDKGRGEGSISFYKKQIDHVLKKNKSVLFLVPEMYKIEYFRNKFPFKNITVINSKITRSAQYALWKETLAGSTQVLIGTRSALSLPLSNLGLIIVDEEENLAYKSFDQQPHINAKTMAIQLGVFTGAQVVLGSNLPSIESFQRTRIKKYALKTPATQKQQRASVSIVDMREELRNGNYSIFSKELQKNILSASGRREQIILFISRKGLATGLLCRDCGYIAVCSSCDVPLVYHRVESDMRHTSFILICNHCGQRINPPKICLQCESARIKYIGAGTQRVEQDLLVLFKKNDIPENMYRIARMDTDTSPSWKGQALALERFYKKKYTILVGTQLMLKQGLLPKVRLAAVVTLDPLLSIPDFRTNERIYSIVDKLRTISLSTILLQTYIVDSDVHNRLNDPFPSFAAQELGDRSDLSFPPFSQIIKLSFSHSSAEKAEREAQILKNKLEHIVPRFCETGIKILADKTAFQVLGPAPAFIPKVKNRYIWQIMIKSQITNLSIRNRLLRIVPSMWKIDVDPVDIA